MIVLAVVDFGKNPLSICFVVPDVAAVFAPGLVAILVGCFGTKGTECQLIFAVFTCFHLKFLGRGIVSLPRREEPFSYEIPW